LLHSGKQVALQIVEIANEVIMQSRDRKPARLQVRYHTMHASQSRDGRARFIYGRYLPSERGEVYRMASVATGNVECPAGWQHCGGFDQQWIGNRAFPRGVGIKGIPVFRHAIL